MSRIIVSNGTIAFVWSTVVDAPVSGWAREEDIRKHYPNYPVEPIAPHLLHNRAGPLESRISKLAELKRVYGKENFKDA